MGILLEVLGEIVGEVLEAFVCSFFGKRTDAKREKEDA
jgi:hypothetical protein